ncbi:MAG: MerR family transcriptional regulator [Clostridiales bacterium]|nr:MerR family transcriptional regulator [Clostridiales bacterium]
MRFRIGDFSKLVKLPVKTLRYYEEAGIFPPDHVDPDTGYRYYSAGQIPVINEIILLREIGFSISELDYILRKGMLREGLLDMMAVKELEINQAIRDSMQKLKTIQTLKRAIQEEASASISQYKITVRALEDMPAVYLAAELDDYSRQGHLWEELLVLLEKNRVRTLPGCYTIYSGAVMEPDDSQPLQVEIVKPVAARPALRAEDRLRYRVFPGWAQAACLVHKGEHKSARNSYKALIDWIEEHRFVIAGNPRELYLENDLTTSNPMDYVTEIQIPIEASEARRR